MDLSNLINNEKQEQIKNQFNSAELNFEQIEGQKLVDVADTNFVNIQQIQQKQQKQKMLKDMFVLLSKSSDISYIIKQLKTKYGNLVTDKVITCCMKLCDVIGNYLITCRYNDDLGNKSPSTVKYVLFCDCGDNNCIHHEIGAGNIDGFFKENQKVVVPKVKMCKKHNLPVLANIDDLNQNDFNELVKKISQVNNVQKTTDKTANVITKIARVFHDLRTSKKQKYNNLQYAVKQANTQLIASVGNKSSSVQVNNLQLPKQKDFKVANNEKHINVNDVETNRQVKFNIKNSNKQDNINMPTNNITVNVKKAKKSIDSFTIKPNKYKELSLANIKDNNTTIMAKDMPISVQKQAKYVENICIKTEPVDEGFDMKDEFIFDIDNNKVNDIVIDTKNDFNF